VKSVSGKRFCKILEKHGWEFKRTNGSHHIYSKAGKEERISVPVHGNKDLKIGLLRSHMKSAGLSEDDM